MAAEELVGPVPAGWEYTTLGAACQHGGGDIQTGPFGSQLHAADYVPIGIPSIMPLNIGDNRIVENGIARITPEDAKRLSRYLVRRGDIVYSRRGDVERCALVRNHEDGWLCGTGCLRVRLGDRGPDPRFATYYLGHPSVREWVVRHAHGAKMPNLNTGILGACPLVVPPPDEQRAIAHILGTLDDKIELNRRMNETLEEIARALFQSWFVDFDPVRAKAEGRDPGLPQRLADLFPDSFEDSELGEIPRGWGVGCVGDEFNLTMGQSPPGETYNELGEGLPFYQGRRDFGSRFPRQRVYCTAPTRFAKVDDTLISVRAPVGDINVAAEDCAIGCGVAAALHRTGSRSYTYQFMLAQEETFARFEGEGTVFGSIGKKDFHSIPCVVPPRNLVREFETRFGDIDSRVEVNEHESRSLANLRDTLLPKLICGDLRVPGAERYLERMTE
ncbi:restriction endonuclease subunit S [Cyanobium sp. LEGE 06143]|uniref:restriction endonuclease subunit S n=1 Tax=Cyanobium sp. LEGE 06143 TaxID=945727 RepID=UPI0018816677|nr:restriction endonuclease subunit S [Cyanobium sp. LEGE 06143]MBE9172156.1 restriction endonuclease subunit S [Cyanobium sp. LEGE 06143]